MLRNVVAKTEEIPRKKAKDGTNRGRPTKLNCDEQTLKQIEGLARIQCTMKEAGAVLGLHERSFSDFLHANKKALESWEFGQETGKASLRRNQAKMAESNPTMAIWLGKQMLGQKDQAVVGGDPNNPVRQVLEIVWGEEPITIEHNSKE